MLRADLRILAYSIIVYPYIDQLARWLLEPVGIAASEG